MPSVSASKPSGTLQRRDKVDMKKWSVWLTCILVAALMIAGVAAIAAVRRELGSKRAAAGVALLQCALAWVVAFVVHCVGALLGLV